MSAIRTIMRRELYSFFADPLALVLGVVFLSFSAIMPLYFGGFFERDQADLEYFFAYLPWILMILAPALGMRSWAEERKTGTIEMVMTWPAPLCQWVVGKFLAGWALLTGLIVLTAPVWIAMEYLGDPDPGPIMGGYIGIVLIAGCYLAASQFASSFSRNQVIAFVAGAVLCFALTMAGSALLTGLFGLKLPFLSSVMLMLSTQARFADMAAGLIRLPDLVFFGGFIALFLGLSYIVLLSKQKG